MKEFMKKIFMWSLAIIALASLMFMASESNAPMTPAEIILPKVIALAVFAGCVFFGKYAQGKGWLPKGEKPFNER